MANQKTSAYERVKLIAREASTRHQEDTAELAQCLRDTRPITVTPQVRQYTRAKMTPRSAQFEDNKLVREIAAFLNDTVPPSSVSGQLQQSEMSPNGILPTPNNPFRDASGPTGAVVTPIRATSRDWDSTHQLVMSHCSSFSRKASCGIRKLMGYSPRSDVSPSNEPPGLSDLIASTSPATTDIARGYIPYGVAHGQAILHGLFDIAQPYYLRDRLNVSSATSVCSKTIRAFINDIPLCSHDQTDHHLGSCKMLMLQARYFALDESGRILQYAAHSSQHWLLEKVLQINENSIAVASDAIPGKHWSLRVSHCSIDSVQLQEVPFTDKHSHSGSRRLCDIAAQDMLIVFDDSERFALWMSTVKEIALKHKTCSRVYGHRKSHSVSSTDDNSHKNRAFADYVATKSPDDKHLTLLTKSSSSRSCTSPDTKKFFGDNGVGARIDVGHSRFQPEFGVASTVMEDYATGSCVDVCSTGSHPSETDYRQSNSIILSPQYSHTRSSSGDSVISHSLFEGPSSASRRPSYRRPSSIDYDSSLCLGCITSDGSRESLSCSTNSGRRPVRAVSNIATTERQYISDYMDGVGMCVLPENSAIKYLSAIGDYSAMKTSVASMSVTGSKPRYKLTHLPSCPPSSPASTTTTFSSRLDQEVEFPLPPEYNQHSPVGTSKLRQSSSKRLLS